MAFTINPLHTLRKVTQPGLKHLEDNHAENPTGWKLPLCPAVDGGEKVLLIWILPAGLGVDRVDIPDNRKAFLTPCT